MVACNYIRSRSEFLLVDRGSWMTLTPFGTGGSPSSRLDGGDCFSSYPAKSAVLHLGPCRRRLHPDFIGTSKSLPHLFAPSTVWLLYADIEVDIEVSKDGPN